MSSPWLAVLVTRGDTGCATDLSRQPGDSRRGKDAPSLLSGLQEVHYLDFTASCQLSLAHRILQIPCVVWVLPAWLCAFQQELGIAEFITFCPSSTNKTSGLLVEDR